jgi:hypothetical protein
MAELSLEQHAALQRLAFCCHEPYTRATIKCLVCGCVRFRVVVPSVGLVVTEMRTLAGGLNGTQGAFADGMGQQAGFDRPYGVAVDSSSNVFVAERFTHRIRKVTPDGGMFEVYFFA